jgi:hypothetical protein
LNCRFCNTELEPNRCLHCNWPVRDVTYQPLSCNPKHKLCGSCSRNHEFVNCRTKRHTYCKDCYRSKAAAFATCCDDVCSGCDQEFAVFDGGQIYPSNSGGLYCETCASRIARRGY